MAFDVEAAKQEGYTDEEIQAYLRSEQGTAVPTQEQPGRGAEVATTLGMAIPPAALDVAKIGGVAYGAKKLYDVGKDLVANRAAQQAATQGAQQAVTQGAQQAVTQGAQATGTAGAQAFNQMGNQLKSNVIRFSNGKLVPGQAGTPAPAPAPAPAPVAPPAQTAPVATNAQQSMLKQGMEYATKVRQIAMDKVIQNAGALRGAGAGAALMGYHKPLGPEVPMSGPYRGMEINPMTNRPWTVQELAQYR